MEEESIPWPWIADYTPEGDPYYINQENGEQVWEIPVEAYGNGDENYIEYENTDAVNGIVSTEYQGEWYEGGGGEYDTSYDASAGYEEGWDNTSDYYASEHVAEAELPKTNAWGAVLTTSNKELEISYKVVQAPLFEACESHDEEAVISILESLHHNVSLTQVVNQVNAAGMTALHVCCLFGSEKCALALIANKADVRAVDKFGSGCLHYIARSRVPSSNLLRLLINKGCDTYFEEKLAHYTAREELVLEHSFLRALPAVWEQRLDSFDSAYPHIQDTLTEEVSPSMLASLPLPIGWEKLSDELGTFFYCERTDVSLRERPSGSSPRGAYEVLLSNFNNYLNKCQPWYGGKGAFAKSGPDDYAEDDELWEEKARVKKKVISAMNSVLGDEQTDDLNAIQRRSLECYCILRREEMRVTQLAAGKPVKEPKNRVDIVKKKKTALLGLCGYWNPLVAMKVLSLLMENIDSTFITPNDDALNTASAAPSRGKKAASKLDGVKNNHVEGPQSSNLPLDYEIAASEYKSRCKRLVHLSKAEKTLKRLQTEGKGDGDQAKKLTKEVVKLRAAFELAHHGWLTKIAVDVLPMRVALCESLLRQMGFSLPTTEAVKKPSKTPASPKDSGTANEDGSISADIFNKEEEEEDEEGEEAPVEPSMPLDKWTPNDVAWAVYKRLPPSVSNYERRTIMCAIRDMEISGQQLFPQLIGSESLREEEEADKPPTPSTIYPTLSSDEKIRLDYVVESLGFDNKMTFIQISTVLRSLVLKSRRWSQMNAVDPWEAPNPIQDEDGRLLEHVIGRIGALMVEEENSLQKLTLRLKLKKETDTASTHSNGSNFSFLEVVHAKEAVILEQHVAYQKEQRSLLHDALERFKLVLLPLPSTQPTGGSSPPSSPQAGAVRKSPPGSPQALSAK